MKGRSVVVVLVASLVPIALHASPQTPDRSVERARTPAPAVVMDEEVRRLTDSVLKFIEREQVISRALQEQARGTSYDAPTKRRAFVEELQAINLQKMRLQSRLASWCHKVRQPDGWMGISFSGRYHVVEQAPLLMKFLGYPRIEAVEPDSPAARAGIAIGDTIVAFEGDDLVQSQAVRFSTLLRPGNSLLATIRRDGETRSVRMRITPRPAQTVSMRCGEASVALASAMANPVIDVIRLDGGYAYAFGTARPGAAPRTPETARTPQAVVAPVPPMVYVGMGGGPRILAGAEVVQTEKEVLQESFGAQTGLFVSRVLQGSPAYQSGLRAGDVIVSANGSRILSPVGFQRAIAEADERGELKLSIIRKKKPVTILLRWTGERND